MLVPFSSADVDAAYERHCNRLLDLLQDHDAECSNCRFYCGRMCEKADREVTDEEYEKMSKEEYQKIVSRLPDDYCDYYEPAEE